DLSPTLALQMLRAGIEEERLALGLSETGKNVCDIIHDDRQLVREAVREAQAVLDRCWPIRGGR
ncbi:MAG: hypothetical protein SH820_05615, partial [Xanthomonadales bacterium]|nr:hypothetical protein [Xanthomonadales bacterium]